MILTCPQCSTRYQASDAAFLPSGRRVRCAKCGHSWHQAPPAAEAEARAEAPPPPPPPPPPEPEPQPEPQQAAYAPPPEPAPEPEPEPAPVPAPPRRAAYVPPAPEPESEAEAEAEAEARPARRWMRAGRVAVLGGWAGLAAAIVLIGWIGIGYRQQIAMLWPKSASVYAALGLPVNARGLAFADVRYAREHRDKKTVLAVSGMLVNVGGRELAVPPIRATLTNGSGHELYHWDFTPDVSVLRAGQSVKFLTRLPSPPDAARHLTLQFVEAGG